LGGSIAVGAISGAAAGFVGAGLSFGKNWEPQFDMDKAFTGAAIGAAVGGAFAAAGYGIGKGVGAIRTAKAQRATAVKLKELGYEPNAQVDPADVESITNSYFMKRITNMKYKPKIEVQDEMYGSDLASGLTTPLDGNWSKAGRAKIYIYRDALYSNKRLVYVMQHELTHADQISSGQMAKWVIMSGGNIDKAIYMSEAPAYKAAMLYYQNRKGYELYYISAQKGYNYYGGK